ncbi:hypothetical protein HYU09_00090 [Candidatus Woesearchaeota archaeon]|nr:hypothetical protein [Candidatus Woesearchaeota archaeon]
MNYAQSIRAETRVLARQDYDPLDLHGRIELVNLNHLARGPNSAVGEVLRNSQRVLVTNGQHFIGQVCLVRFDLEHRIRHNPDVEILHGEDEAIFFGQGHSDDYLYPLKANFISTEMPWGFEERIKGGLSPEEFILYGRMKPGPIPSFEAINRHYDPGKIGVFVYIRGNGENRQIYIVSIDEVIPVATYVAISDLLPRPHRRSRLVVVDSKKGIKALREEIIDKDIVPVRMEPLL